MPVTCSSTLRVAHSRVCPNVNKTSLDSLGRAAGCTCRQPSYYTLHRDSTGRAVKGPRVKDRKVADQALRKLQVEIDQGRVGVGGPRRVAKTFDEWAEGYLTNLEVVSGRKGSTIRAYRSTLIYTDGFKSKPIGDVSTSDMRQFVRTIRDEATDATLHKHLRHLGAILNAAEEESPPLILRSPLTRKFVKDLKLKVPRGDEAYSDVELAKLWAKMEALEYAPVYVLACKLAVTTGARQGELIAATWGDR